MVVVAGATRVFSPEELAAYDGRDGRPSYVAVNGVVYDVSTVFLDGRHFEHPAGRDLTGAFLRQHVPSALSGYPMVGWLAPHR